MVVAPGRMIDSFLSILDAEYLPLYRMVLKLACVCVRPVKVCSQCFEQLEAVQIAVLGSNPSRSGPIIFSLVHINTFIQKNLKACSFAKLCSTICCSTYATRAKTHRLDSNFGTEPAISRLQEATL
jgi:hypothetical protein